MLIKKNRIPIVHILTIGILPSFLKKFVYRLKGYKIARHVKLSFGSVVIGKQVEIGSKSTIGFFTIIRGRKIQIQRYVKIGALSVIDTENIFIDDDARINEQVYIGGIKTPESSLHLGKRTIIMQMSCINPAKPVIIGDDSGIGGHCLLFTHGSWNSQLEGYPVKFAPITIGKKVWLPWRVFVMPGVTIGDNVVIGADSMLNKDIPSNSFAAGSPAKIIKENFPTTLSEEERKKHIDNIFSEFIGYLKYQEFKVQHHNSNNGFEINIKKNSIIALVKFCDSISGTSNPSTENNILILNKSKAELNSKFSMVISLEDNSRLGTSDVGEELVNFLSRYGIRFNRLD